MKGGWLWQRVSEVDSGGDSLGGCYQLPAATRREETASIFEQTIMSYMLLIALCIGLPSNTLTSCLRGGDKLVMEEVRKSMRNGEGLER